MTIGPDLGRVKDYSATVTCKKCKFFLSFRHKPDGTVVVECPGCGTKSTIQPKDRVDKP